MDNQTDPATAGAQPIQYGPPPEETYSRSDEINPQPGYGGPTNIGSTASYLSTLPASLANTAASVVTNPAVGEAAGAEGGATIAEDPRGANVWENFNNGLKLGAYSADSGARETALKDSITQAIDDIQKASGANIPSPYEGGFADEATKQVLAKLQAGQPMNEFEFADQTWLAQIGLYQKSLQDLLAKHQGDDPNDAAIRAAIEPALNMNQFADQWVKDAQAKAQMDYAKSSGNLLPWLASTGGEIVGGFRNPINLLGLFVGGPELGLARGVVGRVLEEGASQAIIQMGLTGAQEPGRQERAAQLGEETGFWPVMHDLENSALGGFIGGSVMRGLHEIGSHSFGPTDHGVATEEFLRRAQDIPPPGGWPEGYSAAGQWRDDVAAWEAQRAAQRNSTAVVPYEDQGMGYPAAGMAPEPSPGTPPGATVGGTAAFNNGLPKEIIPAAPSLKAPPEIANLPKTTAVTPAAITARELDVAAAPPTDLPNATPQQSLETYSGMVRSGESPDVIGKPVLPPFTPASLPATDPKSLVLPPVSEMKTGQTFIKDDKPVTREDFDPTKLQTNAEVFQYKGGGNAQGVTDRLKGVGQWDPIAGSDPMVVYQWSDGREDVVNGHQRTGLARSLAEQGSLPEGTRTPGFVFKQADGWSPTDVRAYAAKVNLMQGSGDVLDSARILRDRPDIWDKALPTSDIKLKQAKGLAELSDDGWGMVLNGHVKPNLAALVGQGVPDKSAHSDLLKSIIDFKNADENSTRMMIGDANAAGFRSEDQSDIFGPQTVTKSLLRERAEVYSRVIQALRDDKKVFGLLDREAERIESVGNVLTGETNLAQADRATQLANILEKLAVRQGPVSAALNRAANLVAEGGKAQGAARTFLKDIDRLMREEGLKLTIPAAPIPRTDIDVTTIPGAEQQVEGIRQAATPLPDELFGSQTRSIPDQRQAIFEDMREKLIRAEMPMVQADANAAVMAARYIARAARIGRTDPETLYRSQGLSVRGDRQRAEGAESAKEGEQSFNQPATVPTFYSSVASAVDNAKLNKASPEQWLATLKNLPAVKPEEVKWLGLEDWLKGQKGSVTKAEVADYVRANQIEVNEIQKGAVRVLTQDERQEMRDLAMMPQRTASQNGRLTKLSNIERRSNRYGEPSSDVAKYAGYTLPGGKDYRELLLTLPPRGSESDYRSKHWEERNVLAHIRFDDREVSGGRALHLAEVQSDWHQEGRRKGYGAPAEGKVPEAPFKTTWPELSMKRMIRYAAENGYDRITWDTGQTNAARYDLSKQLDELEYHPESQSLVGRKDGSTVINQKVAPEKLEDFVGKDVAKNLLAQPITHENQIVGGIHFLNGQQISVGGAGMEGFYDNILPAAVDKLTKKFDGKTEWAKIEHNDPGNMKYEGPDRTRDEMIQIARDPRSTSRIVDAAANVASMVNGGFSFQEAMEREGSPALAERVGGTLNPTATMVPVHSLKLTQELKEAALNEGFPLFAKATDSEPRGRITLRDDSAVIDLFKKKNASTFMHEAGHKFLDEMGRDAAEEGAPQGIKDDFKEVLDWLGAPDAESINEKQHEKFAKGWEQYLREGKAPSSALKRIFEQFKEWLRAIYKSLVGLGKEIPDNIRAVMDRMIATDDEIAERMRTERDALRVAPPTEEQAAAQQTQAALGDLAAQIDPELKPLVDAAFQPPTPEPGEAPPKPPEPLAMAGTKLEKTVDMRATGLRPKAKGDGLSPTAAAQVTWAAAKQSGRAEMSALTERGWEVLRPTEEPAIGQPHIEVTPEGVARFYDNEKGPTPAPPGATEASAAGEQTLIPGVEPITDADRAQAGAEKPLRGGDAAPPIGGLFDEDAKRQVDWMDLVPSTDDNGNPTLVPVSQLRDELAPDTPEEKVFFQSIQTPEARAIAKKQKALTLAAQQKLVKYFNTHRTIDGRRDMIIASYDRFEDNGYSGEPSVRFYAEALVGRTNEKIAEGLQHFSRKTFYSDGSLVGGRRNRADIAAIQRAAFGEKTTPDMQRMAGQILEALEDQVALFNEKSGGTIKLRKNWGGPQSHAAAAVYRAGGAKDPITAKANWTKYIDPLLDWAAMQDSQTGEFMGNLPQPRRQAILERAWEDIVTDGQLRGEPGQHRLQPTSVANSRSDHRFFIFKDADSKIDYNKNYGAGDFISQVLAHVRMMARDTALMEVFGPNPKAMLEWEKQGIMKEAAKAMVGEPSLIEGYKGNRVMAASVKAGKTLDGYYAQFRGDPYDAGPIAIAGTILRNLQMGALLGSATIVHAISNPIILAFGRFAGGVPAINTVPHIIRAFSQASKAEMLRGGLDVEQGAYNLGETARYLTRMERIANATRWFPDRVVHLSGLHPFVEANRGAMRRGLVSNIADLQQKSWDDLPSRVQNKLRGYGLREPDWSTIQAAKPHEAAIGSAPWIRPVDIESVGTEGARDTAIKFGAYIAGETEVGVPTSSLRSRAFLLGDSDPNTFWGFLRRSTSMFKGFIGSFMLTQARMNAEQATRGTSWTNPRVFGRRISLSHAAALYIAMSIAGTVAFSLKQMAAGKETPSLDPTTPEGRKTWLHGMLTGGAFGWVGDFLASMEDSYGRGPFEAFAGPAAGLVIGAGGTAWDAFTSATTKPSHPGRVPPSEVAIKGGMQALRNNFPGQTIWWARAALARMVFDQLQNMVDPQAHFNFRKTEHNLLMNSNQKFWWRPGDFIPREWPWQHSK